MNLNKNSKFLILIIIFVFLFAFFFLVLLIKNREIDNGNLTNFNPTNTYESDVFFDYISSELDSYESQLSKVPDERQGNMLAWGWAYAGEGCLIAYKKTKDIRFLDIFVESFDEILKFRDSELRINDDYRNRIVNSWGSGIVQEEKWITHITTAGRITYPVSEFIRIVYEEDLDVYTSNASKYLDIIVDVVDEFEEDWKPISNSEDYYYYLPTTNNLEPINHVHAIGNTFINLYLITGEERYKKRVQDIGKIFLNNVFIEDNGSYSWRYWPKESGRGLDDISEKFRKSGVSAPFVFRAWEANLFFTEQDIRRITDTFLKNILVSANADMNRYISLRNFDAMTMNSPKCSIAGWLIFSKYDNRIKDIIVDTVTNRKDLFPQGWFKDACMARGYAYLLKE